MKNIAIVGMGALGIMYGHFIEEKLGPGSVTFLADDERIKRYRAYGAYCNGQKCSFEFSTGADYGKKADLLIFAVKYGAIDVAIDTARPVVGKETIILSLLNGIVSEEIIGKALGMEHIVYCVAQGMDAVHKDNRTTYSHLGQICMGIPKDEDEKKPMFKKLRDFFDYIDLPYTAEDDVMHRLWGKWMLNVGLNQVVMVKEGNYGTVQQQGEARELMKSAMREVIALAQKEGISLSEKDLDEYMALTDTLNPNGMPSMRQDGLARRRSEVELFSGTVVRKAKQLGISVPVNEELYKKIKSIEAAY